MVRPILPKLNPTPKVDPKANAAQIAQLEAQAAQLREQIRLANKMGEREWAATARQELTQVTGKLDALQQPPLRLSTRAFPSTLGRQPMARAFSRRFTLNQRPWPLLRSS